MISRSAALNKIAPLAKENQALYQVLRDLIVEVAKIEEEIGIVTPTTTSRVVKEKFRDAWEK